MFCKVRYCAHHVLDELLPLTSDSQHNLRKRRHNLTLPQKNLLKTLLLDYCTKTPTDFHPGFPVTWLFPYIITQLRSVSCFYTIKIGLDWLRVAVLWHEWFLACWCCMLLLLQCDTEQQTWTRASVYGTMRWPCRGYWIWLVISYEFMISCANLHNKTRYVCLSVCLYVCCQWLAERLGRWRSNLA